MNTPTNWVRILRNLTLTGLLPLFCLAAHAAPPSTSNQKQGVTMTTNPRVKMTTSQGDIIISLDAAKAPKTVANFLAYVNDGFFDGTIFHRVIDGFMIQGGGFEPGLKQKPTKGTVENEANNGLKNNKYTLAMARTQDPHSATAQFFINVADNTALDTSGGGYAVFGRVISGMSTTIQSIKNVQVQSYGTEISQPLSPPVVAWAYSLK
jgi:peptidyl-prolyl cis-trans isomerase B (cyclophilin B)